MITCLLTDSCVAAILMILSQQQERDVMKENKSFISMDAPHTLIIIEFLQLALPVPKLLDQVGCQLRNKIDIYCDSQQSRKDLGEMWLFGGTMMTASFIRGCSWALPPWAIEATPELFSSLYVSTGSSPDHFVSILRSTLSLKLTNGENLAGKHFGNLSEDFIDKFLTQAHTSATRNDAEGWRRFKGAEKSMWG